MFVSACLFAFLSALVRAVPTPVDSAPNPIESQYPLDATGTYNETIIILPVPYAVARAIVPAQYALLPLDPTLFPNFPAGDFPVLLEAGEDVDVTALDISPGLNFQSIRIQVPFVDLLHDGYSAFQYGSYDFQILGVENVATLAYGIKVALTRFDPDGEPYAAVPGSTTGAYYLRGYPASSTSGDGTPPYVNTQFQPLAAGVAPQYPLATYINVTNQPIFGNGLTCDKQDRLFNTSISASMTYVQGNVTVEAPYLPTTTTFTNIQALRVDTAFIEHNYQPCSEYKGV